MLVPGCFNHSGPCWAKVFAQDMFVKLVLLEQKQNEHRFTIIRALLQSGGGRGWGTVFILLRTV